MPSGIYTRSEYHRQLNSEGHKQYWKDNLEARRRLSEKIMKLNTGDSKK